MQGDMPFRFLDLPKELRFIVYENLDIRTKEFQLLILETGFQIRQRQKTSPVGSEPGITVSVQALPVQIFSTCWLIYSESLPFLTRKLDKIRETEPRIAIDAACLYSSALEDTQKLLFALLDNLNNHPFFTSKPTTSSLPRSQIPPSNAPQEFQQWLSQTTHLLLSQRPQPCHFAGFMGTRTFPTVRLVIEVPKLWKYNTHRDLTVESLSMPPLYTGSVTSQLSQLYGGLVEHTKGLMHVKSGAIVFDPEDERVLSKEGLLVTKKVALDFAICRIMG